MSTQTNGDTRGRTGTGDTTRQVSPVNFVGRPGVRRAVSRASGSERQAWQGRVEHIASGRSAVFTSRAELLAFLSPAAPPDALATDETPLTTNSTKEGPHVP